MGEKRDYPRLNVRTSARVHSCVRRVVVSASCLRALLCVHAQLLIGVCNMHRPCLSESIAFGRERCIRLGGTAYLCSTHVLNCVFGRVCSYVCAGVFVRSCVRVCVGSFFFRS